VSNGGWAQAGRTAILTVVILIVVVIAGSALVEALVQRGGASTATNVHVFAGEKGFTADLANGQVISVKADTQSQTIAVGLADGSDYTVAYPSQARLDRLLREHPGVHYSADGKIRQ
jgi:hypothetical protein